MKPDGLHVQLEAISPDVEAMLVIQIELLLKDLPVTGTNERSRIARFGWDYTPENKWLGDAPTWVYIPGVPKAFESVTVNEFPPGNGIGAHIDSKEFDEPILVLSLNDDCTMSFVCPMDEEISVFVPRRTLLTLKGDVRNKWTHAISGDHEDTRFSIVFRHRIM